jgi:hypothetical protein
MGTDPSGSVPIVMSARTKSEPCVSVEDYHVVGRIGRPHVLKGHGSVEPRTDDPDPP